MLFGLAVFEKQLVFEKQACLDLSVFEKQLVFEKQAGFY